MRHHIITINHLKTMTKASDLKYFLSFIPDDAVIVIDNNYDVQITEMEHSTDNPYVYNLKLSEGWSITKDEVLNSMFEELRRIATASKQQ